MARTFRRSPLEGVRCGACTSSNGESDLANVSAAPVTLGPDDIAEIIFTSGATADPKGVIITHRNVLANIVPVEREVLKYRKWGRPFFPLRFLNLLPLSHMFGQAMATFVPPMLPGVVVFMRGYNPAEIAAQIKSRRVSVLVSVPKILDSLGVYVSRSAPEVEGQLRPGKRTAAEEPPLAHGSALVAVSRGPPAVRLEVLGVRRRGGSARSCERGVLGRARLRGRSRLRAHRDGADRGVEPSVRDDAVRSGRRWPAWTSRSLPTARSSCAERTSRRGTSRQNDETARAFEDGWFHTGDIGEMGPDGQLFVRGRKKEMIVTPEGMNVFPEDVERVLNRPDPGVREWPSSAETETIASTP